jgi:hypothetical protein
MTQIAESDVFYEVDVMVVLFYLSTVFQTDILNVSLLP